MKQNQLEASEAGLVQPDLHIELSEASIGKNFNDIDFENLPCMTKAVYDSLQLNKVVGLDGYDTTYLSVGRVLLFNDKGKIITIQVVTDGELTEYLLSYDKDGNLRDNLIVAYEDMVENYSEITSIINDRQITVQSVEFSYFDENGETSETSDTAITKYDISPELKFIMN